MRFQIFLPAQLSPVLIPALEQVVDQSLEAPGSEAKPFVPSMQIAEASISTLKNALKIECGICLDELDEGDCILIGTGAIDRDCLRTLVRRSTEIGRAHV